MKQNYIKTKRKYRLIPIMFMKQTKIKGNIFSQEKDKNISTAITIQIFFYWVIF